MATYKLIQDIEAEDHILGPLSLRQFIFALVAVFFFYLSFIVVTRGVPFLLVVFLPPAVFCGFFAFPFGRDQPTEIWFLAKLRFWFVPRKRIWNQTGVKELVTITVPKKVERVLTNGLSQTEVKSRLQALANTIDSRGWAIKNVNIYAQPVGMGTSDDRLIDLDNLPQDVPEDDSLASNDILDTVSNPVAQQVDNLVTQSAQNHHQKLVEEINAPVQPAAPVAAATSWFTQSAPAPMPMPAPAPTAPAVPAMTAANLADEAQLSQQLRHQADSQQASYSHLRTMQPLGSMPAAPPAGPAPVPSDLMTTSGDPAILALASNDDLDVATLARQAHKDRGEDGQLSDNEVVVSLR